MPIVATDSAANANSLGCVGERAGTWSDADQKMTWEGTDSPSAAKLTGCTRYPQPPKVASPRGRRRQNRPRQRLAGTQE
jgi:hypothetical protein